MSNPYLSLYTKQSGSGIAGFGEGAIRSQKGKGFFSNLIRLASPVLKFFGRQAVKHGANLASDLIEDRPFKEAAQERLKEAIKDTAELGANKLGKRFASSQSGSGIKRFQKGKGKIQKGKGRKRFQKGKGRKRFQKGKGKFQKAIKRNKIIKFPF